MIDWHDRKRTYILLDGRATKILCLCLPIMHFTHIKSRSFLQGAVTLLYSSSENRSAQVCVILPWNHRWYEKVRIQKIWINISFQWCIYLYWGPSVHALMHIINCNFFQISCSQSWTPNCPWMHYGSSYYIIIIYYNSRLETFFDCIWACVMSSFAKPGGVREVRVQQEHKGATVRSSLH